MLLLATAAPVSWRSIFFIPSAFAVTNQYEFVHGMPALFTRGGLQRLPARVGKARQDDVQRADF
jgi:hypothetical protein